MDFSNYTDQQIDTWIANHESRRATDTDLYRSLLEERGRRASSLLSVEKSLAHLIEAARTQTFTSYKTLAVASGVNWTKARHAMNGATGHLDHLLGICHARGLPLLTALCVNQQAVATGNLSDDALQGFIEAAQRLGYSVGDHRHFLKQCQADCFEWGRKANSAQARQGMAAAS